MRRRARVFELAAVFSISFGLFLLPSGQPAFGHNQGLGGHGWESWWHTQNCNRHGSYNVMKGGGPNDRLPRHWHFRVFTRELTSTGVNCSLTPLRKDHRPEYRWAALWYGGSGPSQHCGVWAPTDGSKWEAVCEGKSFFRLCGPGWECWSPKWYFSGHASYTNPPPCPKKKQCISRVWHEINYHCRNNNGNDDTTDVDNPCPDA